MFLFQSDFNDIVNHKKFLELDVSFLLKVLQQPNFQRWCVTPTKNIIIAVNKWVNNKFGERKKYRKVIKATIRQFLDK